ncbi:hypothetical protein HQ585_07275 [candidate division KSB1 bacterium]|nr:hypothetical protein [candidate division KSB1 bacterium]
MKKTTRNIIFWTPRVLCMLYALFLSIFALDVFGKGQALHTTLLAFVIHLIPTFLILLLLLIAWRWEWIGTVVSIGLAVFYMLWTRGEFPIQTYLIMSGPLLLVGFLFILGWTCCPRKEVVEKQKGRKPLLWITLIIILLVIVGMLFIPSTQTPPEKASILKPVNGSEVPFQTPAMGEFTEDLIETDLWLVIQPKDSVLFHPQPGPIFKPPGRMTWYSTVYVGAPEETGSGEQYTLYLFAATEDASQIFKQYLEAADENQLRSGLTVLPDGLTSLATIQVVRE